MINQRSSSSFKGTRSRLSNQSGYTILEVAIASFVMVMGLTSSIIAMQVGFRQVELARDCTIASQIMQSEIERIRMMSWSEVNALATSSTVNISDSFYADTKLAKFGATIGAANDSTRPTEVKKITVVVVWTSYDGAAHSRSMSAIYAKNGLYDFYYTKAHE